VPGGGYAVSAGFDVMSACGYGVSADRDAVFGSGRRGAHAVPAGGDAVSADSDGVSCGTDVVPGAGYEVSGC